MKLLQLRYFITAAQLENISQAARIHGIPQPALSYMIKKLEQELEQPLFERIGNRIQLNDTGRQFADKVSAAIAMLDDACLEVRDTEDDVSGDIRLLILTNRRGVTEAVTRFYSEYPCVRFFIAHEQPSTAETFDLLVIDEEAAFKTTWETTPLIDEILLAAISRSHPLAKRETISLGEMKGERFVTMPPGSSLYRTIHAYCDQQGFTPDISVTCDDPYYIRRYVSEGLGVSLVPSVSWKGLFDDRTVLLKLQEPIRRQSVLAWNSDRYMSKAVRCFKAYLLAAFEDGGVE